MTSRLLAAAVLVLGALALPVASASAAPGATAAATTCPATFQVLHNDRIGAVSFPGGPYRIVANGLQCRTASALFARFLQDFDGVLPNGWSLNDQRVFSQANTTKTFATTPVSPTPPPPSTRTCPGTFSVLHNDHVGAMSLPAGRYTITRLTTKSLSCAAASRQFAYFLAYDWAGSLPRPWRMNVAKKQFSTSSTNGFTVKRVGSSGGGGNHPNDGEQLCPATFRVLNDDRIGALVLPAGAYDVWTWGGLTCAQSSALFREFLSDVSGNLPDGWSEIPAQGEFLRGREGFRVKPAR